MSGAVVVLHQNRLMRRFQDAKATDPKTARTLADIECFAAQQDCAGFCQFEWSTTWKEEDGSFFQVGGGGMFEGSAAALAGARQVAGVLVSAGRLVPMVRSELSRGDKKTSPFLAKRSLL